MKTTQTNIKKIKSAKKQLAVKPNCENKEILEDSNQKTAVRSEWSLGAGCLPIR